jgi:hypothetical protein
MPKFKDQELDILFTNGGYSANFDSTPGGTQLMTSLLRSGFIIVSFAIVIATYAYAQEGGLQQAIQRHMAKKGPPMEAPRTVMADLDRNGSADAVVSYCINENAAGGRNAGANNVANVHCAVTVFTQKNGRWVRAGENSLGRGKVRDVKGGVIYVESVTFAPKDPLCCPSRKVSRRLGLKNGKLVQLR